MWIFSKPDFSVGILKYAVPQVNFYNGGGPPDPHSPGNTLGGDSKDPIRTPVNKPPKVVTTSHDMVFKCKATGLKPDTIHKFYYENVDRTKDCKQTDNGAGNKLGGPLKTDESGSMNFLFYFTVRVEEEVDALNKVNYNLLGDKLFMVKAEDSTAKKIVPFVKTETTVVEKYNSRSPENYRGPGKVGPDGIVRDH